MEPTAKTNRISPQVEALRKIYRVFFRIICGFLWFCVLLNLVLAIVFYFRVRSELNGSIRTTGVVTRFVLEDRCYFPVVTVTNSEGKKQTLTSNFGKNMNRQERLNLLKTEIPIFYREGEESFSEDTFLAKWFFALFFLVQVGGLLLLLLILFVVDKILSSVFRKAYRKSEGENSE
ncbi:hypothetical protein SDC9_178558 [bioreactor metagenome]|uniref:Uncharacterized protein n=1 Tax=bioreactor metagenome TaxID=1076179 RepID=A0A645H439_9ZZZZ